jgi:NifU-like protein involved in Fe-S cluster formation
MERRNVSQAMPFENVGHVDKPRLIQMMVKGNQIQILQKKSLKTEAEVKTTDAMTVKMTVTTIAETTATTIAETTATTIAEMTATTIVGMTAETTVEMTAETTERTAT